MAKRIGRVGFDVLVFDDSINLGRFTGGVVAGVTVKDDYALDEMLVWIVDEGGVNRRLAVFVDKDGKHNVIQGNRRGRAVKMLHETPVADLISRYGFTADAINKARESTIKLDVEFIEAGSLQEAMAYVNDQDVRPFSESGCIRLMFDALKRGMRPTEVAKRFFNQIAQYRADGRRVLAEAAAMSTESAKEERIISWLNSYVVQEIAYAYECGPRTQQAYLAASLFKDQLTTEKLWEMPGWFPMSRSNLSRLHKARNQDGVIEGESFNATWKTLEEESKKTKEKKPRRAKKDGNAGAGFSSNAITDIANKIDNPEVREILAFASGKSSANAADAAATKIMTMAECVKVAKATLASESSDSDKVAKLKQLFEVA